MSCAKCGNMVPANVAFCSKCGNPMAGQGANQNVQATGHTFGQKPGYTAPPPPTPTYTQGQAQQPGYTAPPPPTPAYSQPQTQQPGYTAPPPPTPAYPQPQTFGPPPQQPGYGATPQQPMYNAPQGQPYAYPQHAGGYPRASSMPNKNVMLAIGGGVAVLLIIAGIFFFMGGRTNLEGTWENTRNSSETIEFRGNRFTWTESLPFIGDFGFSGTFVIQTGNNENEGRLDLTVTGAHGLGMDIGGFSANIGEIMRLDFELSGNTLRIRSIWGGWDEYRRR